MVTTRFRRHSPQFFGILPASVDGVIDDRPVRAIDVEESLGMQHAVDAGRDQHASKRPITKPDIDNVTVIDGKFRPSQIVSASETSVTSHPAEVRIRSIGWHPPPSRADPRCCVLLFTRR